MNHPTTPTLLHLAASLIKAKLPGASVVVSEDHIAMHDAEDMKKAQDILFRELGFNRIKLTHETV